MKPKRTKVLQLHFCQYSLLLLADLSLSQQVIKENIDKNVIEELLSSLVSSTLLNLEIKDLNLVISDKIIAETLKKNKNFLDENGNFQRTLYEKFLLTNSMSAAALMLFVSKNFS